MIKIIKLYKLLDKHRVSAMKPPIAIHFMMHAHNIFLKSWVYVTNQTHHLEISISSNKNEREVRANVAIEENNENNNDDADDEGDNQQWQWQTSTSNWWNQICIHVSLLLLHQHIRCHFLHPNLFTHDFKLVWFMVVRCSPFCLVQFLCSLKKNH